MNLSAFGYVRVAAVSPAVRVADVEFNLAAIVEAYRTLRAEGVQIAVFPELATVGYTCGDLLLHTPLLDASDRALDELAELVRIEGGLLVVGAPIRALGRLYNCAAVFGRGGLLAIVPKRFVPNYGEYYEQRWFSRPTGSEPESVRWGDRVVPFGTDILVEARSDERSAIVGIELCEDLWAVTPPSERLAIAGADVLLNLSASNEVLAKSDYRRDLVRMQSARCIAAYVYASAGAGESTTDTVFSGHCIVAENGTILAEDRAFSFDTRWVVADVDLDRLAFDRRRIATFGQHSVESCRRIVTEMPVLDRERLMRTIEQYPFVPSDAAQRADRCREIVTIQQTALAKRLLHVGVRSVVLGISGGLDSALALLVCVEAFDRLGYDRRGIHAAILPGPGTSEQTRMQAEQLARSLSASVHVVSITDAVERHLRDIGHGGQHDATYENAQARERTQILMDLANRHGAIMIGTSDLSELALGWTTYGGDHMSMYGVNAGVPKTLVRSIIEWWMDRTADNDVRGALSSILATPISPELLPPTSDGGIVQRTEEVLGPYVVHDFFLYNFVRWGYSAEKVLVLAQWAFEGMYTKGELSRWLDTFVERFFGNQFKRSCLPDGPKIGSIALSPRADWRMPSDANPTAWKRLFL
ncbi:MAG: NAD(+) synthase [Chlorobi bacterium]|nr:NAD(+) synthase [Chlorobiota bacterium]